MAPAGEERLPDLHRVPLPAVQLEAVLAGVPGPGDEALGAGHLAGDEMVVGDVGETGAGERLEQRLGMGALHRQEPHLAGDVLQADVDAALLLDDVLPGLGGVRGVDHDHQLVVEPVHGAVVDEGALGRQDRGVLDPAGLERADVVAGDPVHEGVPVGPGDLELAHVGDVEHPGTGAHRVVLGQDARWGTAPASPTRRTGPSWRPSALWASYSAVRLSVGSGGHDFFLFGFRPPRCGSG